MDNKKTLNEEELNSVNGGFPEEMQDIANAFRDHGFENEAVRLEKAGAQFFRSALKSILTSMGFQYRLTVDGSNTKANYNNYNGVKISHWETLDIINRFLDSKKI